MHRALLLCILLPVTSCTSARHERTGMANPASVHCIDLGGRLEIRQSVQGQAGYCHLPDGRVVDEWQLFRSDRQLQLRKRTMPAP